MRRGGAGRQRACDPGIVGREGDRSGIRLRAAPPLFPGDGPGRLGGRRQPAGAREWRSRHDAVLPHSGRDDLLPLGKHRGRRAKRVVHHAARRRLHLEQVVPALPGRQCRVQPVRPRFHGQHRPGSAAGAGAMEQPGGDGGRHRLGFPDREGARAAADRQLFPRARGERYYHRGDASSRERRARRSTSSRTGSSTPWATAAR